MAGGLGKIKAAHIAGQPAQGGAVSSYSLANPLQLSANWLQTGASRSNYSHDMASMLVTDLRALNQCDRPECQVLFDFNEQNIKLWDISGASNLAATYSGPTRAIDHNGFVRGNRYYMSNYQRGLTILDITDPAAPVQAGFFDTFPASDSAAFNGMWGVYPYLPSGLILGSDINSGLYLFKENTINSQAGALAFSQRELNVSAGDTAQLQVQRLGGNTAVSVGYEILAGRAEPGLDYQNSSGRLSWAAGDSSSKTVSITTLDRGLAAQRELFIRLFNPANGVSLASPSYLRLKFGEDPARAGIVTLVDSSLSVVEANTSIAATVRRLGGSDGAITVGYALDSGSATVDVDMVAANGELSWAAGDSSERQIIVQIIDDELVEADETAVLRLFSVAGSELGEITTLTLNILDNDANTAPTVSIGENRQVNAGQSVTLNAQASDQQGDAISYQWQQVSGPTVSLQNANSAVVSLVAPATNSQLVLSVTATDARGAAASASITLTVVAIALPPPAAVAESSGGSMSLAMLLVALLLIRRRPVCQPH
ncbi:choice-of-anchor B family protein [Arsukibacterium sp. MJ3]|uniref:choice-of-anchor B family protein n=1 Tax=Arsukibacterium sp. MJ3 TaxID=1632859 RepID=UPI000ACF6DA6|nr:choice-of-anchor B family protein [Arsukibacterium sp. MJ3]